MNKAEYAKQVTRPMEITNTKVLFAVDGPTGQSATAEMLLIH